MTIYQLWQCVSHDNVVLYVVVMDTMSVMAVLNNNVLADDILVMMTYWLWWRIGYDDILVMTTYYYDDILVMMRYWLWWHIGYDDILVMMTCWLWWYIGYDDILDMVKCYS